MSRTPTGRALVTKLRALTFGMPREWAATKTLNAAADRIEELEEALVRVAVTYEGIECPAVTIALAALGEEYQ